jgi:hypothetical protein
VNRRLLRHWFGDAPGDNRPWTPALRKELLGAENAGLPK